MYYIYDASGDVIGFRYGGNTEYFYGKNAQGDVVALFDSNFELLARYYYDAWGTVISVKDANGNEITDKNNIAYVNPIRYRSYYYDSDTGFYYLNSRYYDPQVGRFINADVLLDERSVLGYNLFAYCWNNPVCFKDVFGQFCVNIVILPPNVVTSTSPIEPSKTISVADCIIIENAEIIKSISSKYNVDSLAVAGAIYAEQSLNVDLFDSLTNWLSRFGFNTSVGIGQVTLKTAEMLEKEGYISATKRKILFKLFGIIPVYEPISVTRSKRLNDNTQNITYVAVYIRYMIDVWQNECPDISSRIDILTTLYNNGKTAAHSNPKSSPFGNFVQSNLDHISHLLYG